MHKTLFCSFSSRVSTFPSLEHTLLELTKTCAVEPHFTLPLVDYWWWTWARMMRSLNRSWLPSQVRALLVITVKQSGVTDSLSKLFSLKMLISLLLKKLRKTNYFPWLKLYMKVAVLFRGTCEWRAFYMRVTRVLCASSLDLCAGS